MLAKFHEFSSTFSASKTQFISEKKRIIIIILTITIGLRTGQCSGPNNPYNNNRALALVSARALIILAKTIGSFALRVLGP